MKSARKREIAGYYFTKGMFSQSEIAEKVEVSEVTISNWRKKYKWDEEKKINLNTKPRLIASLYNQLDALNTDIQNRDEGKRYASSKEGDAMMKISNTIKNLETDISAKDTIDVFMNFTNWLREEDLAKAKELINYMDSYVKTLL